MYRSRTGFICVLTLSILLYAINIYAYPYVFFATRNGDDLVMTRFTWDGSDEFHVSNKTTLSTVDVDYGSDSNIGTGIAFAPDGKLYVATRVGDDIAIQSFNWDGDSTFSNKTTVTTLDISDTSNDYLGTAIAFDMNNNFYAATRTGDDIEIYRFDWDEDTGFSNKTYVTTRDIDGGGVDTYGTAMTFVSNGKLYTGTRIGDDVQIVSFDWNGVSSLTNKTTLGSPDIDGGGVEDYGTGMTIAVNQYHNVIHAAGKNFGEDWVWGEENTLHYLWEDQDPVQGVLIDGFDWYYSADCAAVWGQSVASGASYEDIYGFLYINIDGTGLTTFDSTEYDYLDQFKILAEAGYDTEIGNESWTYDDLMALYNLYVAGKNGQETTSVLVQGETWYYRDLSTQGQPLGSMWTADGNKYIYLGSGLTTEPIPEPLSIVLMGIATLVMRKRFASK